MDHAETIDSEGRSPQNAIADDTPLRRNSMLPSKSMAGADVDDVMELDGGGPGAVYNEAEALEMTDVDDAGTGDGSVDGIDESEFASSSEAAAPSTDITALLMSPAPSVATTGDDTGAVAIQTADLPAFDTVDDTHREVELQQPSDGGPPARGPVGEPAFDSQAIREAQISEANNNSPLPQQASNHNSSLSEDQRSFDQGLDMSVDEDDDDNQSDKASSVDAQLSDHEVRPPPQDQTRPVGVNERAPLENIYGPFIHPTDTSLEDARERLQIALEQTRLLRTSFTEQAYERYRCVMKPVPESLYEILEPIQSDPSHAGAVLHKQIHETKIEKDLEKKQAHQAGVGLEEVAYFGEGLHLVVLPEDDIDETDVDLAQFPHRGPTDPQTGKSREDISAAAATTTEQVFDRIRRIRAIRMGAEIVPAASRPVAAPQILTRNPVQEQQALNEPFSPGFATSSSPAPSDDSNASDNDQASSKGLLDHLLTLAPSVEGARPDGSFTAVQSALMARGVGMNEVKHDHRINPLRQRMVQLNYFSPTPSYRLLPPLLGPNQLYRLQATDIRKKGLDVQAGARESIKSVVEEICSAVDKGKCMKEDVSTKNGISGGDNSSATVGKGLVEERSTSEIGLLNRMRSTMLVNQRDKRAQAATSESVSHVAKETMDYSVEASPYPDTGDFDPLLAFSVMNAVGLIRKKKGNDTNLKRTSDVKPENAYARALGLDGLLNLEAVSKLFQSNSTTGNGRKRCHSDIEGVTNEAQKPKLESNVVNMDTKGDNGVYQIRGGGNHDEGKSKETGEMKKQKKNGVAQIKNMTAAPIPDQSSAGYAVDRLLTTMSQAPLVGKQNQNLVAAAAASRQLLQHQLGIRPDPYAALAHQLAVPIGSHHLSSLPASDISDYFSRNGLARNPDWSSLRTTRPDVLAHHQQLNPSVGLLPGQLNLSFPEQEAARAMLLRDHQNIVTARAQGAAAAARYQASLPSLNPQHPFGLVSSSLTQHHPNETRYVSSLPAIHVNQQKGTRLKESYRKRALSLSEKSSPNEGHKEGNGNNVVISDQSAVMKRPASAPPSPRSLELNKTTPNGSSTKVVSRDEKPNSEPGFTLPPLPEGLQQEIADLIVHAKFHEAHSLSQKRSDESQAFLITFLLSLGAVVPIPKELIADILLEKLSMSNFQLRLHEFVGSSSSASAFRDVIIAIISTWLWAEHKASFKELIEVKNWKNGAHPSYKWLIDLTVETTLSAMATSFDSRPSRKRDDVAKEISNEQVAIIASQALANEVYVDNRVDASFPILEDLQTLLDSLRTNALQARTQERVLLAALASRCGIMSEAFSNAYVSSIVRAGVALGHENVCEIGQDEECRASTMLPYDFFHDHVGVWEEPCRPITGYHPSIGGDELKQQAHARSVIQKSTKQLQNRHGLKGGISDGGPYFPVASKDSPAPTNPAAAAAAAPLVRTPSGSLKRRGSFDAVGPSGTASTDTVFNPDHSMEPMLWNPYDVANFPYGNQPPGAELTESLVSEKKKRKLSHVKDGNARDQAPSLALEYRSTQELEWEDVANMFFHGGSTRNIDINYDFGSNDHLGKKKIIAPFVRELDRSNLNTESSIENEPHFDEDVSDEKVLQRHQEALNEMKLKLDTALDTKQLSQPRGRKR